VQFGGVMGCRSGTAVVRVAGDDQAEQCDKTVAAIENERDAQIAELEVKRVQARIAG